MFSGIKKLVIIACVALIGNKGWSQACSTLGQSPSTAFPVCGTNVFSQTTVPVCSGKLLPTPCAANTAAGGYTDKNPYWYKFTCYATGTFGFVITPKNLGDDYDWELFDITGHNPTDVYTTASLIVSANWSGSPGPTGISQTAPHAFECASNPTQNISTFSTMPTIIAGHDYLLMISHYDDGSQSGYDLTFPTGQQGGTASIVNPVIPTVADAYAVCDGTQIVITMNKKINCSSSALDGTDFSVTGGPVPISIVSASGTGCSTGFDADNIVLTLNRILSPGTYTVNAKTGTDGNTLTDNCSNSLITGAVASIKFTASQPTPLDSISPVICITDTLQLIFSKPINCNSIAADGSDFVVTGPAPVTVKSAAGICSSGVSSAIRVFLSAPIKVNGNFQIAVKAGSDGNTLIDECGQVTPAGSIPFTTKDITTAAFGYTLTAGCIKDTIVLSHDGNNGANQWQWMLDNSLLSTAENTVYISNAFGTHVTNLLVSNGRCSDTAGINFVFADKTVKAAFAASDTLCVTDTLHFTDMSSSSVTLWKWDFGNGNTSTLQAPPAQTYPLNNRITYYVAGLQVTNSLNCSDSTYKLIYVLPSCYVAVPSAFTPNGDGLNDYLYPLNAYKAGNLLFRVFNRYGQLIFESQSWSKKWDGRVNGQPQPSGTYVWTLDYTDIDKQQKVSLKGTTVLIR